MYIMFRLSETNLSSDLLKKNIWTKFFNVQMTVIVINSYNKTN